MPSQAFFFSMYWVTCAAVIVISSCASERVASSAVSSPSAGSPSATGVSSEVSEMRSMSSSPSADAGSAVAVRQRLRAHTPAIHFSNCSFVFPPSFLDSHTIGDLRVDGRNEYVYLLEQCHQQNHQNQNNEHCHHGEDQRQNRLADGVLVHCLDGVEHQGD